MADFGPTLGEPSSVSPAPKAAHDHQPDRPHVRVDPAQRFGSPNVKGISTDAVAGMILAGEMVDTVMHEYDLTRADVLVACWYEARYGRKRARRTWQDWLSLGQVDTLLWRGHADRVMDPPSRAEKASGVVYAVREADADRIAERQTPSLADACDPSVSDEERDAFGVALAEHGWVPEPDDPVQQLVRAVANRVASERRVVEAARAWFVARYGSPPFPIRDEEVRRIDDRLAGAVDALDNRTDERAPMDELVVTEEGS